MNISEVRAKVTVRDLATLSVYVQTTQSPYPLRLVKIGRKLLTVLSQGTMCRVDPACVTEIRM